MVTVCLTNVTALILKLMTSQELQSREQECCCPFLPVPGLCQLKGSLLNPGIAKHVLKLTNPSGEEAVCAQLSWRHSFHKILVFRRVFFQAIQQPVQLMVVP